MITASLSSPAEPYFRAWNTHDPDGIAAALAEGGTYTDPTISGAPLTGAQIAGHARAVLTAFPDLSFEVLGSQRVANGTEVVRWLMRGTNTGPLRGLFQTRRSVALPGVTGRSLALPGVDVITVADGKIGSVQGYFDRQTMAEQLGLQVIVQPHAVGGWLSMLLHGLRRNSECCHPTPEASQWDRTAGLLSRRAPKPDRLLDGRGYRGCTSRI